MNQLKGTRDNTLCQASIKTNTVISQDTIALAQVTNKEHSKFNSSHTEKVTTTNRNSLNASLNNLNDNSTTNTYICYK